MGKSIRHKWVNKFVTDGKGRTTTLAAITSFASLMVISSLGKDPSTDHVFNDVYGDIMQDILEEDTESEKANSDDTAEKVEFDLGRIYNARGTT